MLRVAPFATVPEIGDARTIDPLMKLVIVSFAGILVPVTTHIFIRLSRPGAVVIGSVLPEAVDAEVTAGVGGDG